VINADTSYRILLGRPWLHDNYIVPSTLPQCMKYVKDGEERRTDREMQPLNVYEVRDDDAKYFLEPKTRVGSSSRFKETATLETSKLKIKRETKLLAGCPHFWSDSEDTDIDTGFASSSSSESHNSQSDKMKKERNKSEAMKHTHSTFRRSCKGKQPWGEESDSEEDSPPPRNVSLKDNLKTLENLLMITQIPDSLYKDLVVVNVLRVGHQETFYASPFKRVQKGTLFYKSGPSESGENLIWLEDPLIYHLKEVRIPKY